jgi:hypothetical protein
MHTSFTLTHDDFARCQKIVMQRLRRGRRGAVPWTLFAIRFVCGLLFGMGGAILFRLMAHDPHVAKPLMVVAACVASGLLAMLLGGLLGRSVLRKSMLAPDGAFLATQTVRLSAQGVSVESEGCRSEVAWARFLDAEEDAHNHYLFLDAAQTLIVPKVAVAAFDADLRPLLRSIRRRT